MMMQMMIIRFVIMIIIILSLFRLANVDNFCIFSSVRDADGGQMTEWYGIRVEVVGWLVTDKFWPRTSEIFGLV